MRYLLILLLLFLSTSCYTSLEYTRTPNTVTSVLAVTSQGDTVQVPTYQFYTNYQERPAYYNDWRFYYRDTWYNPHSYYSTYYRYYWYRPFNTWNYTPYTYPSRVEPKRDSKPRSSGTTGRTKTERKERSSQPRTTGRSTPAKKSDRPKEPQRKKRGGGTS
jgi:hypothetical protein